MKKTLISSLLCLLLAFLLVFTTACGTDGDDANPNNPADNGQPAPVPGGDENTEEQNPIVRLDVDDPFELVTLNTQTNTLEFISYNSSYLFSRTFTYKIVDDYYVVRYRQVKRVSYDGSEEITAEIDYSNLSSGYVTFNTVKRMDGVEVDRETNFEPMCEIDGLLYQINSYGAYYPASCENYLGTTPDGQVDIKNGFVYIDQLSDVPIYDLNETPVAADLSLSYEFGSDSYNAVPTVLPVTESEGSFTLRYEIGPYTVQIPYYVSDSSAENPYDAVCQYSNISFAETAPVGTEGTETFYTYRTTSVRGEVANVPVTFADAGIDTSVKGQIDGTVTIAGQTVPYSLYIYEEQEVSRISLSDDLSVVVGGTLDITDITARVTYYDDTDDLLVPLTADMFTLDTSTPGYKTVVFDLGENLTYTGYCRVYADTDVEDYSISLNQKYILKGNALTENYTANVRYLNGSSESNLTVTPEMISLDTSAGGVAVATVTLASGEKIYAPVYIYEQGEVESVYLDTSDYIALGDTLEYELEIEFFSGSEYYLTKEDAAQYVTGNVDTEHCGEYTLTATYGGKVVTRRITVKNYQKSIVTVTADDYAVNSSRYAKLIEITVTEDSTLEVYSSADFDTYGYLFDSEMNQLTSNDDGGSGNNFKFTYTLSAGTYYIGVAPYSTSNLNREIPVYWALTPMSASTD